MKLIKIIMLYHVSFQSGTGQQAQHVAPVVGPWDDQKKCEIQKTIQKLTSSGKKKHAHIITIALRQATTQQIDNQINVCTMSRPNLSDSWVGSPPHPMTVDDPSDWGVAPST